MGRRGAALSMKVVLPSVSWLAVMRLLKKAPKNLPSAGMGTEMVMKAMMGCRAMPETESLRYGDDYLAEMKGRQDGGGRRRPKPAALLPMMSKMSGCTSRPHTDSFRVHHVVNQEALQLMLALDDDDDLHETFFVETYDDEIDDDDADDELICYGGIIRDGDRLLRDDHYDDCARAISSSSSRLSSTVGSSRCGSSVLTAPSALSRSSVDSEGQYYSTATSTSCPHTPAQLGPHVMRNSTCASSPASSCTISSCCLQSSDKFSALELFGDANSDYNLNTSMKSEAWEFLEGEAEELDRAQKLDEGYAENLDWIKAQEEIGDKSTRYDLLKLSALATGAVDDLRDPAWMTMGGAGDEYVDECTSLEYEGDDDDDIDDDDDGNEAGNMVAEVRYSEDPLEDFADSIEQMVLWHQLNQPVQLHHLHRCYLHLNSPTHHPTITLAFLRALRHLGSHDEPHLT